MAESNQIMVDSQHQIGISRSIAPLDEEPDDPSLHADIEFVLASLGQGPSEVSIRIVAEAEIAELNAAYRQRDGATNVLSFPAEMTGDAEILGVSVLGDIAICSPVLQREAAQFQKLFQDRYRHILIHGLLHLLGHDHQDEEERQAMESLETTLLEQLGVSNPYE